jgi:hypothetical protein
LISEREENFHQKIILFSKNSSKRNFAF